MNIKAEKFKVEGFSLEEVFNKEFLDKINELGEFFPVQMAFVRESDDDKVLNSEIVFGVKNTVERKQKIIHIESSDTDVLENLMEKLKNDN